MYRVMESTEPSTDGELMRRARRDPQAFDAVYERHGRAIQRWLRGRTDSPEAAWELTAEVFAQAWLSRRRFRPDELGSAAPWLYGIAANVMRHAQRRRGAAARAMRRLGMEVAIAHVPDEDAHLARIVAEQLGPDLEAALQGLPDAQRQAIALRVVEELPYEVIAVRLGCTAETVRMRVMRGLRALSTQLEGRYP